MHLKMATQSKDLSAVTPESLLGHSLIRVPEDQIPCCHWLHKVSLYLQSQDWKGISWGARQVDQWSKSITAQPWVQVPGSTMVPNVSARVEAETRGLQGLADFLGDILPQKSKAEIAKGGNWCPLTSMCVQRCIPLYTAHTYHTQEAVELRGAEGSLCFAFRKVIEKSWTAEEQQWYDKQTQ